MPIVVPPPEQWGPENFVGMGLGQTDLALLKKALSHLKEKEGLSWADIESQAEVPRRRLERFVTLDRRPQDLEDLNKAARWVASRLKDRTSPITRALKSEVMITYEEVQRVWNAYAGEWLCISEAEDEEHFYCMVLTIGSAPDRHDREDFPLPRFALEIGSDHTVDDGEEPVHRRMEGYIQLRDEDLYFIGQTLWEPRGRFGFCVFADNVGRSVRELMTGWALLPTIDRSSPKPRRLAAARRKPSDGQTMVIGRANHTQCAGAWHGFADLVRRLRTQ